MKALHSVIILSIITSFSLHPMNIISNKNCLQLWKKIDCPTFKEKAKQFFKLNDINNIASVGNIMATSTTGNPIYLLQMIPQVAHRTSNFLYMQKELLVQFNRDFEHFLQNKPAIRDHLQTIDTITQEIKHLEQLKSKKIHYKLKIAKLEKNRTETEDQLLNEMRPLFQAYGSMNIAEYLKTKDLDSLDLKIQSSHDTGDLLSLFGFAVGCTSSICVLLGSCCFNPILIVAVPLSTVLSVHHIAKIYNDPDVLVHKLIRQNKELQKEPQYITEILEIKQAHMDAKKNKVNQVNE